MTRVLGHIGPAVAPPVALLVTWSFASADSQDFYRPPLERIVRVFPGTWTKTTLLRCIGGLLRPTSGETRVDGRAVTGPPDSLAIVFQEYGRSLFPWLRVAENVELPLRAKGCRPPSGTIWSARRWSRSTSPTPARRTRGSSRAGCSSGSRSPTRSRSSRGCC